MDSCLSSFTIRRGRGPCSLLLRGGRGDVRLPTRSPAEPSGLTVPHLEGPVPRLPGASRPPWVPSLRSYWGRPWGCGAAYWSPHPGEHNLDERDSHMGFRPRPLPVRGPLTFGGNTPLSCCVGQLSLMETRQRAPRLSCLCHTPWHQALAVKGVAGLPAAGGGHCRSWSPAVSGF